MFKPGDLVKFKTNGFWVRNPNVLVSFSKPICSKTARPYLGSVWEVLESTRTLVKLWLPNRNMYASFDPHDFQLYNND